MFLWFFTVSVYKSCPLGSGTGKSCTQSPKPSEAQVSLKQSPCR